MTTLLHGCSALVQTNRWIFATYLLVMVNIHYSLIELTKELYSHFTGSPWFNQLTLCLIFSVIIVMVKMVSFRFSFIGTCVAFALIFYVINFVTKN